MKQFYENYTDEDFEVWNILFERQIRQFPTHACQEYMDGLKTAKFESGLIPDFDEMNEILKKMTGWQLAVGFSLRWPSTP